MNFRDFERAGEASGAKLPHGPGLVEAMHRAVRMAASNIRLLPQAPVAASIDASPEEGVRLIRALVRIEHPALRTFVCEVVEALAGSE